MARLLGHRQTKETATDKPNLLLPRHIPTLPYSVLSSTVLARLAAEIAFKRKLSLNRGRHDVCSDGCE